MIETLKKHRTDNNSNIIDQLESIIFHYNITSLEELANFEELFFTINNRVMKKEKRIAYAIDNMIQSYWDYDNLDDHLIDPVHKLKQSLFKDISEEEKLYNLVKLYGILEKQCPFLVESYNLIIEDKYL